MPLFLSITRVVRDILDKVYELWAPYMLDRLLFEYLLKQLYAAAAPYKASLLQPRDKFDDIVNGPKPTWPAWKVGAIVSGAAGGIVIIFAYVFVHYRGYKKRNELAIAQKAREQGAREARTGEFDWQHPWSRAASPSIATDPSNQITEDNMMRMRELMADTAGKNVNSGQQRVGAPSDLDVVSHAPVLNPAFEQYQQQKNAKLRAQGYSESEILLRSQAGTASDIVSSIVPGDSASQILMRNQNRQQYGAPRMPQVPPSARTTRPVNRRVLNHQPLSRENIELQNLGLEAVTEQSEGSSSRGTPRNARFNVPRSNSVSSQGTNVGHNRIGNSGSSTRPAPGGRRHFGDMISPIQETTPNFPQQPGPSSPQWPQRRDSITNNGLPPAIPPKNPHRSISPLSNQSKITVGSQASTKFTYFSHSSNDHIRNGLRNRDVYSPITEFEEDQYTANRQSIDPSAYPVEPIRFNSPYPNRPYSQDPNRESMAITDLSEPMTTLSQLRLSGPGESYDTSDDENGTQLTHDYFRPHVEAERARRIEAERGRNLADERGRYLRRDLEGAKGRPPSPVL